LFDGRILSALHNTERQVQPMLIGIDPGHGGTDPGAVSPIRPQIGDQLYTKEATITLDIAKRVQGILLACGHQVLMTRTDDHYVSLLNRSNMINQAKCDIAVSIHLNSSVNSSSKYIATFIQQTGARAEQLAGLIQTSLVKTTNWPDGGVRVKNLHMTRETYMPAVLLELGFVSNPDEERRISDPMIRSKLAAATAEGILAYFAPVTSWQRALLNYAIHTIDGQAEIVRAKEVWKRKNTAGDKVGAEAAHKWANQVRQVMGLPII